MNATSRFVDLVCGPDQEIPLDEAALLIAAHDHQVDVPEQLRLLDALADDAPDSPDALARHLFRDLGFRGDEADYTDPRNSFLDDVLRRRRGLPITLSVLLIEIGRRRGVRLAGVGMPGHFLVRAADVFYDPFHGPEPLDVDACRELFARAQPVAAFDERFLEPVRPRAVLSRMLANLVRSFAMRAPASAVWALRLRLRIPDLAAADRRDAAALLGRLGSFAEAAAELDSLAESLEGDAATGAEREAVALRARAN